MKKECSLCSYKDSETLVHEGRYCVVSISHYPLSPYHLCIFPKGHYSQLIDLPDKLVCNLFLTAKRVSVALRKVADPESVSYIFEDRYGRVRPGYSAHSTLQLVPSYKNGTPPVVWNTDKESDQKILIEFATELKKYLW